MSPDEMSARERADWLLDAVAMATQDRRYLRGDPQYDEAAGAAILMNGEKAILAAVRQALKDVIADCYTRATMPLTTATERMAIYSVRRDVQGMLARLDAKEPKP